MVISLCSTAKSQEAFDAVRISSERNVFWGVEKKKIIGSMRLFYKDPGSKIKWETVRVALLLNPSLLP